MVHCLLHHSPDGGRTLQWLHTYPGPSLIKVFTTNDDGLFTFLTQSQEVWYGHVGLPTLVQLKSSQEIMYMPHMFDSSHPNTAHKILTVFMGPLGDLYEVGFSELCL